MMCPPGGRWALEINPPLARGLPVKGSSSRQALWLSYCAPAPTCCDPHSLMTTSTSHEKALLSARSSGAPGQRRRRGRLFSSLHSAELACPGELPPDPRRGGVRPGRDRGPALSSTPPCTCRPTCWRPCPTSAGCSACCSSPPPRSRCWSDSPTPTRARQPRGPPALERPARGAPGAAGGRRVRGTGRAGPSARGPRRRHSPATIEH